MISSMTAFAGAETEVNGYRIIWEIRTVNHRFLDIALRLPETFKSLETQIRSIIGLQLKRGRVECSLSLRKVDGNEPPLRVNATLVGQLLAETKKIKALCNDELASFTALDILKWPGVFTQLEEDEEPLAKAAIDLLPDALEKLVFCRQTEGDHMAALLKEKCLEIKNHVDKARLIIPEIIGTLTTRTQKRIAEIAAKPDHDRLEQEMVFLAQKLDIAEELDRLDTHVSEFLIALLSSDPIGRRMDFLLQEFNREANTMGSKSADTEISRLAIEIKVLIEQMREQVQNVE